MRYKLTVQKVFFLLVVVISVLFVVIAIINGPVGYWKFEEGSGITTADSSNNGKTGTLLNGPTWVTGKVGKALNFDGVNDMVVMPSNPLPTQITIIAWINPRTLGNNNAGNIFGVRGNVTGQANTYLGLYAGNKLRFADFFDLSGVTKVGSWFSPVNSIVLNQWQQVAVTYDGSNPNNDPKFYINGQLVTTTDDGPAPVGVLRTAAAPWRIGNNGAATAGFNGYIDEVRVYDQVLSATDIASIYAADVAPPSNPPVVSVGGNPSTIIAGQSSTLTWSSTNATNCTASGGWSGPVTTSGSILVSPSTTTLYTLTCTGSGGTSSSNSIITVINNGAPVITFVAVPNNITQGQTTTLTWVVQSVTGGATTCVASGGWGGNEPLTGSLILTPSITTSYTLTCTDVLSGASSSQLVLVIVNPSINQSNQSTLIFYTTFDNLAAITSPVVGSGVGVNTSTAPVANGFVPGKVGNGLRMNALGQRVAYSQLASNGVQNIENMKGTMDFWYQPGYNHDDGIQYMINGFGTVWRQPGLFLGKHNIYNKNRLWLIYYDGNLTRHEHLVEPTNYSWRAGDWVNFRITWDFTVPAGVQNIHLYQNGVELPMFVESVGKFAYGPHTMPPESTSNYISIGAREGSLGTFGPNGVYDEMKIWNEVYPPGSGV